MATAAIGRGLVASLSPSAEGDRKEREGKVDELHESALISNREFLKKVDSSLEPTCGHSLSHFRINAYVENADAATLPSRIGDSLEPFTVQRDFREPATCLCSDLQAFWYGRVPETNTDPCKSAAG